ncbi:MAG: DUF502 domain-containing protein [Deltaproteobacteria bacterium]|jgi:uncharacterized membrane protein|nr:DUF502 domain-containing protein [Deltaproteobacteria bacterium]
MKTVKTMILGGLIFLVPFAIILLVVGKVFGVSMRLAEPVADRIPIDAVAGIALANIVSVAIILLACFVAGIAAKSAPGQRLYRKLDEWLLNLVPRYTFIKSMTASLGGEDETVLQPVMVQFDDLAQIAFEVERGPGDLVTVYLPGSPDPWSGSVAHVTSDRIAPLAEDFASVIKSLRKVGRGMPALLESPSASGGSPSR